ncbi:MAG: hypothetical protein JWN60_995 [Acidobacteria bacterium]|nr:hypothetical protein [Acidobacteriota bacterium]
MKFYKVLEQKLKARNTSLKNFYDSANPVEKRILEEYGAIFVASEKVKIPPAVIFSNEDEVAEFQAGLQIAKENIGGFELELQKAAMKALTESIREAEAENLTITPRGADSARRNFAHTINLWASRVEPALEHWTKEGKLTFVEAEKLRALSPLEQVPEVFKLEEKGVFFSKDLSKSIVYSVAPPGASQHLSLLAFDVAEFRNARVREILAANSWFQTVVSDHPHFTYLGVNESELEDSGLKKVENRSQTFWIPDI